MRQPGKVEITMRVPGGATVTGSASSVRVAMMRAAEHLNHYHGLQLRKGSTEKLVVEVTRTR